MATNTLSTGNAQASNTSVETSVLMWADASVKTAADNIQAQETFGKIYDRLYTFESVDDCEKAIQQLSASHRIHLIVSGGIGRVLLPRIHQLPQVSTIYVFCMNRADNLEWAKQFAKIKAVIVEIDRLISIVQFHREQQINMKQPTQINILESQTPEANNNGTTAFPYTSEYFVNAGELQYTDKTMQEIATEIGTRFITSPNRDVTALVSECAQPLMYLLKREQNLRDFSDPLRRSLLKEKGMPCVSLRLLIDSITMHSNRFLGRRLTVLLSKRNPVPLIQPRLDSTNNEYRSIAPIIHVWDYHRPVLLSFGISKCKGKTSLINTLFCSNFEQSTKDRYFSGTIDVDFGCHIIERRPINIADAHGEISTEMLTRISTLFNGFIIHVQSTEFCSSPSSVIKYLELLSPQRYILLLIRDVDEDNEEQVQSTVDSVHAKYPHCQIHTLPNVSDKTTDENKQSINDVRRNIFSNVDLDQCGDENLLRSHLKALLNDTEKATIEQDAAFIHSIRSVLINGHEEHYPLYSLFTNLCKQRSKASKTDLSEQEFQAKDLYQLNLDLFNANAKLKEQQRMGSHTYGAGFEFFVNLLRDRNLRLIKLRLLSMELKKEAAKRKIHREDLPFYEQLSIEIHWRNAMIGSTGLADVDQTLLVQAYRDYIAEGNPFEIVDGDNFEMQNEFLTEVLKLFPGKKFFVISVIGPQNSGKSTLLNFLFGTLFEARAGRCTKGIYGTLINVQNKANKNKLIPLDYDYILVIDTEGILSAQKKDEQYDKKLILFCLAVSHLLIVNVEGEIDESVRKFLTVCTQALKYLGETRVRRPTVHFVLNKRPTRDEEYCRTLLQCVHSTLKEHSLDDEINLQPENFHILSTAFNRTPTELPNATCVIFSTDINFVTDVQKLCQFIIETSSTIIEQTGDRFCLPASWIEFANRVLQTIKKHPDLTHFQEVFERDQYHKIREAIRRDFDQHLTPTLARHLIAKETQNKTDQIRNVFKEARERMLAVLDPKRKRHCDKYQATENIYKRSLNWMHAQISSIFQSWEISARMISQREKIDQLSNEIEHTLRTKALRTTHKSDLMDEPSARNMFNEELKDLFVQFESQFDLKEIWRESIDIVFHLCETFGGDVLPSEDNLLIYLPFLQTLDKAADQPISMDDGLCRIQDKFQAETVNVNPLAWHLVHTSPTILLNEIKQPFQFLDQEELGQLYTNTVSTGKQTREAMKKGTRQMSSQLFDDNWKTIVQISKCFNVLFIDLKELFSSTSSAEPSTDEIQLVKVLLEKVNNVVQDCNKELNLFNFCLSKQFCSTLHTCAVIATVLYYYNRRKNHVLQVLNRARENKCRLIERFVPWVVLIENDDENVALNCVHELSRVLCQSLEGQIKQTVEEHIYEERMTLDRCSIIKELDEMVYDATNDWLLRYVLHPIDLIIERFDEKWARLKEAVDTKLDIIVNSSFTRLNEIFHFIESVTKISQEQGAHSVSFVDSLFQLKVEHMTQYANDKQFCMAKLFHHYLVGENAPIEIFHRKDTIYTVDRRWERMTDQFPKPSADIEQTFRLLENVFRMSRISYLGIFLDKILHAQDETKRQLSSKITQFIEELYRTVKEQFNERMRGCQARCPCCKRMCDVDHYLNVTSPVGQGENRHRCQSGHQIRGMGGIRYEATGEASTTRCEYIKDDDPVVTENNIRQTWKNFKNANANWDFGDGLEIREALDTPCAHIWERIGEQLCRQFNNGMKFVRQNTPQPVNHFIFVLDHSGSMNETNNSSNWSRWLSFSRAENKTNDTPLTPWEHLLRAVKGFIDIRIRQVSLNDQITVIIFANRAQRIYHRERVSEIVVEQMDTPMNVYGCGTNFSAAFQAVIETLEETNHDSNGNHLRQTIIFVTDGEPQGYPTTELQQLCDYKAGHVTNQNQQALIHNFWTMALGKVNKIIIEKINQTMQGKLVDIEQAEDLEEAYAQIAEIL